LDKEPDKNERCNNIVNPLIKFIVVPTGMNCCNLVLLKIAVSEECQHWNATGGCTAVSVDGHPLSCQACCLLTNTGDMAALNIGHRLLTAVSLALTQPHQTHFNAVPV
jgi:hypothetical protein